MQADEVPVDVEFFISSYFSERNFETGLANADIDSLQAACHRRGISVEGFGRKDEYIEALWWSCMLEQQLSDSESTQQLQPLQEGYEELLQNQVGQQKLLRQQHERQKYLQQQLESHQQCLLILYQHASQWGSHSQQGGVSHQMTGQLSQETLLASLQSQPYMTSTPTQSWYCTPSQAPVSTPQQAPRTNSSVVELPSE